MSEGARARFGKAEYEEGEESEGTEVATSLAGAHEASEAMMEQMAQFMKQLTQEVAPRENSKAAEFKTPSMKAPDSFDGTLTHKLREFIQSCQLIFHNDSTNFFSERKKVM
ncbi:hypothetical protein O181_084060 [Austropuccinia psidii MF-1]|uniref:Uncharacterized protein n=1 Tax=Austropuccinia psidii MF-1 TaxID=1389203 RepID=A0A9Q3IM58_9BASI|nr:hypothetical protein [Austropuccinia psidii MF-1]